MITDRVTQDVAGRDGDDRTFFFWLIVLFGDKIAAALSVQRRQLDKLPIPP